MIILATDTVMLGHFSKEALAAGAIGNTVFFFIWADGHRSRLRRLAHDRPCGGQTFCLSQASDRREVRAVAAHGAVVGGTDLAAPAAVLFFTRPILFCCTGATTGGDAGLYTAALALGLPCSLRSRCCAISLRH